MTTERNCLCFEKEVTKEKYGNWRIKAVNMAEIAKICAKSRENSHFFVCIV
jgi:hypothetical protein